MKNWLIAGNSDMQLLKYKMYQQQRQICQTISSQAFEYAGNVMQLKQLKNSQKFIQKTVVGKTISPIPVLIALEKRTQKRNAAEGRSIQRNIANTARIAGCETQKRQGNNAANQDIDCVTLFSWPMVDLDVSVVEKPVKVCSPLTTLMVKEMSIGSSLLKENHTRPKGQDSEITYTETCEIADSQVGFRFCATTATSQNTDVGVANTRLKVQRLSRKGVHRKLLAVEMPVTQIG